MNKKFKLSLIGLSATALIIAIPLIVLGFGTIEVGYIALSYDKIVANYSSQEVYQSGMHFIGVAREFVRIKKTPTLVKIQAKTYTSDYFSLNSKIVVTYQIQNTSNFQQVQNFYSSYGSNAQSIIASVLDKTIVSVLSQYSSLFYKNGFNQSKLESSINGELKSLFIYELGTPLKTSVLIESLVVDGASSMVESIQKQIEYGLLKLESGQKEKIQISNMMKNMKSKSMLQMKIALEIVKQRAKLILDLSNSSKLLFENSVLKQNLSYFSSLLELRPQLYAGTDIY